MQIHKMDITKFESQKSRISRANLVLEDLELLCSSVEINRGRPLALTLSKIRLRQSDAVEAVRELLIGYSQSGRPMCGHFHALTERAANASIRVADAARKLQQQMDCEDQYSLEPALPARSVSRLGGRCLSASDLNASERRGLRRPL